MNVITCVASCSKTRMGIALGQLNNLQRESGDLFLMLKNFKDDGAHIVMAQGSGTEFIFRRGDATPRRPYTTIIYDKFNFVSEYATDDSVVCLWDDDYCYNRSALQVARVLFEENPQVNYASLLRGPGVEDGKIILSRWPFFRHPSCMGGSTIVRWAVFKEHVIEFFEKNGLVGHFDAQCKIEGVFGQSFWIFLDQRFSLKEQVYTLSPFSLMQHCWQGSMYGHDADGHLYAINYDGLLDPFEWRERMKQ